ncbi:Fatty acid synthase [Aphelenchoides bicaudatus]|nr:Fatty acid synthase [Aphelenchoides bicaudatus]
MLTFCFHEKLQLVGKEKEERRIISNVWVVTGGTKGLGWQLSKHLLQKYSTNVILIARRQPIDNVAREIKQFGERVQVLLADVSNKNQILAVFNQIAQQYNSISIIHSAGIADDVLIQSQNIHRFGRVFEAKCKGLLNLKRAAQQYNIKIDNWILNSSVSSTLGNVGQSNYAAANAFLDAFARLHPNACSINWANWTETGFASSSSITDVLRKKGFYGLKTDEALECFDWILSHRSVDQILCCTS